MLIASALNGVRLMNHTHFLLKSCEPSIDAYKANWPGCVCVTVRWNSGIQRTQVADWADWLKAIHWWLIDSGAHSKLTCKPNNFLIKQILQPNCRLCVPVWRALTSSQLEQGKNQTEKFTKYTLLNADPADHKADLSGFSRSLVAPVQSGDDHKPKSKCSLIAQIVRKGLWTLEIWLEIWREVCLEISRKAIW